jgi:hypothetical protein
VTAHGPRSRSYPPPQSGLIYSTQKGKKNDPGGTTDLRYALEDFDAFKADLATTTVGTTRGPLDERKLGNGERNDELARWTGKWASEGQDFDTVVKLTMGHNMIHCLNPLAQKGIEIIVKSVFKSEAKKLKELGIDSGQERKGKINFGSSGQSGQLRTPSGQPVVKNVVKGEAQKMNG